jgi:HAMP domain-containing protein
MTLAEPLPKTIGKYRITGMLGRGGMGVVYRAIDPDLDREVAIKLVELRRFTAPEAQARFAREARALARLCDPHVVQVFEFQPEGQQPHLVLELVRGLTLRQVLAKDGPLALPKVIDCAWQVLRGLAAAHAAGVVHRDLKPANLMLDANGVYKLVDFGLADAFGEGDLTAAGEVVGTLRYLPPERAQGVEAGPAGDLWSLGATLSELAGVRRLPEEIPTLPPGAGPELTLWFARLVADDPARRYASAGEALAALGAAVPAPIPGAPALPQFHTADSDPTTVRMTSGSRSGTGITGTVRPVHAPSTVSTMVVTKPRGVRIPFVIKLITAIWFISSAATMLVGWAITENAVERQFQSLRRELMGIAADAALLIDPAAHARLAAHPDGQDPALATMRAQLARFQDGHPDVRYIYTMAPLPETASSSVVQFVCDASDEVDRDHDGVIGPDEVRATVGQRYPAKDSPELLQGFEHTAVDHEPVHDQWGEWLSGYAPIRDAAGHSVGLVGVDLPAGYLTELRREFLHRSLILLAVTLIAFLAAGTLVAFRLRRPIGELQRGMLAVAGGDLDVAIRIRTRDEFQVLAQAFAHMQAELRRAADVRGAFEAFVTRTLSEKAGLAVTPEAAGARLYCHFGLLSAGGELAPRLGLAMPRLFALAQAQGGFPERVAAGGVLISFPATSAHDLPQERAVRVALALLAELEHGQQVLDLAFGLAAGTDPVAAAVDEAILLGKAGAQRGIDLLVSEVAFAPIRPGFYADRIVGIHPSLAVFAVKGAVSA